jgi:hypothetical protein
MQTTFIGPDGQEYSLDQANDRTFEARKEDGAWLFTFFDRNTGEPAYRYRGGFPTAFDRDLWTPVAALAAADAEGVLLFAAAGAHTQVA